MNTYFIIFLFAIAAVAFMIIGLMLTQLLKGKPLQSEVGENEEMKRRGLKCAKQQFMEEERDLRGDDFSILQCDMTCGTCTTEYDKKSCSK